jgi:Tfp pilus assembly protein PilE
MSRSVLNSSAGFTLVEVITATVITGVLILVVMTFTTDAFVNISIDSARSDLLRESELALDVITRDVRLSGSADAQNRWQDDHAPGAPNNLLSWQSDSGTLILATAALDQSRNVLFDDALHYVSYKDNNIYFVQNGILYKRVLAAEISGNRSTTTCPEAAATTSCPSDRILAHDVSNFDVRYINGDDEDVDPADARSIELTLDLHKIKYGRSLDAHYVTRAVFRNE